MSRSSWTPRTVTWARRRRRTRTSSTDEHDAEHEVDDRQAEGEVDDVVAQDLHREAARAGYSNSRITPYVALLLLGDLLVLDGAGLDDERRSLGDRLSGRDDAAELDRHLLVLPDRRDRTLVGLRGAARAA